jgi:hypothetical protein
MIDLNNKVFVCTVDKNGDNANATFYCKQIRNIVKATYNGGTIVYGEMIGMVNEQGILQASFNYLNINSEIAGGTCTMVPEGNTLRGLWTLADKNSIESELLLEEL